MQSCGPECCDNYIVQLISCIVFVCSYIMQFYRQLYPEIKILPCPHHQDKSFAISNWLSHITMKIRGVICLNHFFPIGLLIDVFMGILYFFVYKLWFDCVECQETTRTFSSLLLAHTNQGRIIWFRDNLFFL